MLISIEVFIYLKFWCDHRKSNFFMSWLALIKFQYELYQGLLLTLHKSEYTFDIAFWTFWHWFLVEFGNPYF